MPENVAFCSACDRPVPVRPLATAADVAPGQPPQLVCLDYGRRCSGAFCPMVLWIPDEEGIQPAAVVRTSPLPRAS